MGSPFSTPTNPAAQSFSRRWCLRRWNTLIVWILWKCSWRAITWWRQNRQGFGIGFCCLMNCSNIWEDSKIKGLIWEVNKVIVHTTCEYPWHTLPCYEGYMIKKRVFFTAKQRKKHIELLPQTCNWTPELIFVLDTKIILFDQALPCLDLRTRGWIDV